jgi:hypothetical protein
MDSEYDPKDPSYGDADADKAPQDDNAGGPIGEVQTEEDTSGGPLSSGAGEAPCRERDELARSRQALVRAGLTDVRGAHEVPRAAADHEVRPRVQRVEQLQRAQRRRQHRRRRRRQADDVGLLGRDELGEVVRRRRRAQLQHLPPHALEHERDDLGADRVLLARRARDDREPPAGGRPAQSRRDRAQDAVRHRRGEVLAGDVELGASPLLADGPHGRPEHIEAHGLRVDPADQRGVHDVAGMRGVSGEERREVVVAKRCYGVRRRAHPRWPR